MDIDSMQLCECAGGIIDTQNTHRSRNELHQITVSWATKTRFDR